MNALDMMNRKGFTLLEILIAISILATVLVTVFSSYTGSSTIIEKAEYLANIHATARISLERIIEDLESAGIFRKDNTTAAQRFIGKDVDVDFQNVDILTFSSAVHKVFDHDDGHREETVITYYLRKNSAGDTFRLYRLDRPWFEEAQDEVTSGLLLCDGLISMECVYYDVLGEAHEIWDSTMEQFRSNLPVRVSISLKFENRLRPESPLLFTTGVAIHAAGAGHEETH